MLNLSDQAWGRRQLNASCVLDFELFVDTRNLGPAMTKLFDVLYIRLCRTSVTAPQILPRLSHDYFKDGAIANNQEQQLKIFALVAHSINHTRGDRPLKESTTQGLNVTDLALLFHLG